MKNIILVSWFNGLGGASLALNSIKGVNVVDTYVSEIDTYANKIFFSNHSGIQLGDCRTVTQYDFDFINRRAESLNAEIFFIGGFPCQNLSSIGYMDGMVTEEKIRITSLSQYLELKNNGVSFKGSSYLFFELVRALKALNPKYWLVENVRVSHKPTLETINDILGVEHTPINSNMFSPQNRLRFYWSNINIDRVYGYNNETTQDVIINPIWNKPKGFLLGVYGASKRIEQVSYIHNKCHTIIASIYKVGLGAFVRNCNNDVHKITLDEACMLQGVPIGYCSSVSKSQGLKAVGNGFEIRTVTEICKEILKEN